MGVPIEPSEVWDVVEGLNVFLMSAAITFATLSPGEDNKGYCLIRLLFRLVIAIRVEATKEDQVVDFFVKSHLKSLRLSLIWYKTQGIMVTSLPFLHAICPSSARQTLQNCQ